MIESVASPSPVPDVEGEGVEVEAGRMVSVGVDPDLALEPGEVHVLEGELPYIVPEFVVGGVSGYVSSGAGEVLRYGALGEVDVDLGLGLDLGLGPVSFVLRLGGLRRFVFPSVSPALADRPADRFVDRSAALVSVFAVLGSCSASLATLVWRVVTRVFGLWVGQVQFVELLVVQAWEAGVEVQVVGEDLHGPVVEAVAVGVGAAAHTEDGGGEVAAVRDEVEVAPGAHVAPVVAGSDPRQRHLFQQLGVFDAVYVEIVGDPGVVVAAGDLDVAAARETAPVSGMGVAEVLTPLVVGAVVDLPHVEELAGLLGDIADPGGEALLVGDLELPGRLYAEGEFLYLVLLGDLGHDCPEVPRGELCSHVFDLSFVGVGGE